MKKILIDGRFVGVGESVSRYTLEILKGILNIDKENEYTLLIRPCGIKDTVQFLKLSLSFPRRRESRKRLSWISGHLSRATPLVPRMTKGEYLTNLRIEILDIKHYSIREQTKLLNSSMRKKV